jgi:hypothetical protein
VEREREVGAFVLSVHAINWLLFYFILSECWHYRKIDSF